MTKVDNFKSFVKKNPNLINYVRDGKMSWQKFYELYDLYGEENNIWEEYLTKRETREIKQGKTIANSNTFFNILEYVKTLDTNKIQDGITSMQKAISLFGEIMIKDKGETAKNYTPRPVYRRFDD